MSSVTDLVFITPETDWDETAPNGVSRCPQFEDMVKRYGYHCEPTADTGTKCPSTAVYYVGGVNYLSFDLVEEIKAADWPTGTVLYVHFEHDDEPSVTVFRQTGSAEASESATVYVLTEDCGYDVGTVVRGVYASPEAAAQAHPDGDVEPYEVQT